MNPCFVVAIFHVNRPGFAIIKRGRNQVLGGIARNVFKTCAYVQLVLYDLIIIKIFLFLNDKIDNAEETNCQQ